MAEATTISQLTGFTKDIYTKLLDLTPESNILTKLPFDEQNAQGGLYKQNVIVAQEGGFTHAAAGDGAVTSNAGVSMETQDAQVAGFQVSLEGTIDYESAARASNSKRAYADIVGKKLANMIMSAKNRVECESWWGQLGLGTAASIGTVSSEAATVTFTTSSFAPLIWAGKRNHKVVVYTAAAGQITGLTQAAGAGGFVLSDINVNARTAKITGVTAGDCAELKTYIDANPNDATFYWHSAANGDTPTHKSMIGICKAASVSSSTLWNIDVGYDLWAPNQYAVGSVALSFAKALDATSMVVSRGLQESLRMYVNPKTWNNLLTDQAGLRRYGGQQTKLEQGADAIAFHFGSGTLEISATGWMKEGSFLIAPKSGLKRIGAQDVSFNRPGNSRGPGENIFWDNPTRLGYSYRAYTHQAIFCEEPWKLVYGSGIVNT